MALQRIAHEGYGVIEPNQVTFTRDGRIEAQVPASVDVENGMLLAVDTAKGEVRFPKADEDCLIGLNYTSEKIYNQFTPGLKNFKVVSGVCPRIGFLTNGESFTTNAVCYDGDIKTLDPKTGVFAGAYIGDEAALKGLIHIGQEKDAIVGPVLKVTKVTTMPDGQVGVEFQVQ